MRTLDPAPNPTERAGPRVILEGFGPRQSFGVRPRVFLELLGRLTTAAAAGGAGVLDLTPAPDPAGPCCYGLGRPVHDPQTGALFFAPCPTCGAAYAGDRRPHRRPDHRDALAGREGADLEATSARTAPGAGALTPDDPAALLEAAGLEGWAARDAQIEAWR